MEAEAMVRRAVSILVTAAILATGQLAEATSSSGEFGAYDRTTAPFDGIARSSFYVSTRDGTRIAVDIYRPMLHDLLVQERLPVVWTFLPYLRATVQADGSVRPNAAAELGLVRQGYVVAVADVRGTGASFGARLAVADENEANDGYDVTEWLSRQPWSNGKVGMTGCSYYGSTALRTATVTPPNLKAVFVGTTAFDQYTAFASGGIVSEALYDQTFPSTHLRTVAPVGNNMIELERAFADHARNTVMGQFWKSAPYRDSLSLITGDQWWKTASIPTYLDRMAKVSTAFYIYGGMFDSHALSSILTFVNLRNPKKLVFGPWPHCETPGFDLEAEKLRFFDHWLKGINNGIDREPAVHLNTPGAPDGSEWRALDSWPMSEDRRRFFLAGPPGDVLVGSDNERGRLTVAPSDADRGTDRDFVPRSDIRPLVIYGYPRASLDQSTLTYTLPALDQDTEITGIPLVDLWVAAKASDADIYVYLEHVNRKGGTTVISTGVLRASRRAEGRAPYDMLGMPWQRNYAADVAPLTPTIPVRLRIAHNPVSYVFRRGDLVRLAISSRPALTDPAADDSVAKRVVPKRDPAPITIERTQVHPSFVELPFIDLSDSAIDLRRPVPTTFR